MIYLDSGALIHQLASQVSMQIDRKNMVLLSKTEIIIFRNMKYNDLHYVLKLSQVRKNMQVLKENFLLTMF